MRVNLLGSRSLPGELLVKQGGIGLLVVMELTAVSLVIHGLSTYTSLPTPAILLAAFLTSLGSSILFMYGMHRMGY